MRRLFISFFFLTSFISLIQSQCVLNEIVITPKECNVSGQFFVQINFKFIINFYFIKDAVESLQSDIIHLMYDTDTRPIYITDKGTNSAIHIISLISDAKSYKTS